MLNSFLRTLSFWFTVSLITPPLSLFTFLLQLLPAGREVISHRVAKFWARCVNASVRIKLKVTGLENIPEGPVVFMGNHQSYFDIFVLYSAIDRPFSWLAKKELFDIPFLGWGMRRAGYIPIDRGNLRAAVKSIRKASEALVKDGRSIIIFPEGTRGDGKKLLPFRPGGFDIAIKAGVPIVPFVIKGTSGIMPKGSFFVRGVDVEITFLPPVPTKGLSGRDRDMLMDRVRLSMCRVLEGDDLGT